MSTPQCSIDKSRGKNLNTLTENKRENNARMTKQEQLNVKCKTERQVQENTTCTQQQRERICRRRQSQNNIKQNLKLKEALTKLEN
jgi:hypothetical protein